ncbi:MAG: shikimate dehydrogenase [Dehalococcoidales bacterium]|nr:shikimate dehydrogenase [Dehalococcoidales bacterium]
MTFWSPSGRTVVCGIIGDPIEHTLSPVMHNAAFRDKGIDYLYLPFRVKSERVGEAVVGMKALNIKGLNVTIPHKVTVMKYLDKIDSVAEKIGAVNTIVNGNDVLTGYNTDASGFLQALLDRGIDPAGKKVVILGAGGASRAISFILAERGAYLTIFNRAVNFKRVKDLADRISQISTSEIQALELNRENLERVLDDADILVNATSVGMSPDINETPVAYGLLKSGLVVFDIIYNPVKTRLIKEAEMAGAITINGIDMLVWQGALAFEKWTEQKAPVNLMKIEVTKALEGNEK